MLFDLIAASLLAAPVPIPAQQPGPSEYPSNYLRQNASAAALLELVIDEKGKAVNCRVSATFGNKPFADSLCGLIRRSRWRPAVDVEGRASIGVISSLYRMYIPDTEEGNAVGALTEAPDMQLEILHPPSNTTLPTDEEVALQANEAGTFTACAPKPGSLQAASLLKAACEQAMKATIPPPTLDNGGRLPQFVTELTIRFVQAPLVEPQDSPH